jgi:hypothetical protein
MQSSHGLFFILEESQSGRFLMASLARMRIGRRGHLERGFEQAVRYADLPVEAFEGFAPYILGQPCW